MRYPSLGSLRSYRCKQNNWVYSDPSPQNHFSPPSRWELSPIDIDRLIDTRNGFLLQLNKLFRDIINYIHILQLVLTEFLVCAPYCSKPFTCILFLLESLNQSSQVILRLPIFRWEKRSRKNFENLTKVVHLQGIKLESQIQALGHGSNVVMVACCTGVPSKREVRTKTFTQPRGPSHVFPLLAGYSWDLALA